MAETADVLDNTRGAPTSYSELARVIEALPLLVREARRSRRLSLRAVEEETGIGYTSLHRIEHGGGFEPATLLAVLRWLDGPAPDGHQADDGADQTQETITP